MRRLRGALALFAVASLVLVVAAPAAAGESVPFRMHVTGLDRPLDMAPGTPPFLDRSTFGGRCTRTSDWVTTIDSHGTALHLGTVTVLNSHCTRFDFLASPPIPATFTDGRMTVTAANGDELWITYTGSFLFYPVSEAVGTSMIDYGPMTIVGGTGRFTGATGTVTGSAVDQFPAGPNVADFHGTITYDASSRSGG